MHRFKKNGNQRLLRYVANRLQRKHGVFISAKAEIPRSTRLRHPIGIVIGDGVSLGEGVIIYQNVTIGGARVGDVVKGNYPSIGKNTIIFAGAIIIGNIKIGNNCVIGANAVVTKDIPDNSTAVGVPAKILSLKKTEAIE